VASHSCKTIDLVVPGSQTGANKMRSPNKLSSLLASALLCGVVALAQPAKAESLLAFQPIASAQPPSKAETPLALQAVASVLAGSQNTATSQVAAPGEDPVAALAAFARGVRTEQPVQDDAYSALLDFQRMAAADGPKTVVEKKRSITATKMRNSPLKRVAHLRAR
jgi:hypothetical protein